MVQDRVSGRKRSLVNRNSFAGSLACNGLRFRALPTLHTRSLRPWSRRNPCVVMIRRAGYFVLFQAGSGRLFFSGVGPGISFFCPCHKARERPAASIPAPGQRVLVVQSEKGFCIVVPHLRKHFLIFRGGMFARDVRVPCHSCSQGSGSSWPALHRRH